MITQALKTIAEMLFPKLCLGCRKSGTLLCSECWSKVEFVYAPICPVCRQQSVAGLTHPSCQTAHGIDGLLALTYYHGPIKNLIRQLKYQGATVVTECISQLIDAYVKHQEIYLPPAIIISVPLHQSTQSRRGFNQAEIIARLTADKLQLPFIPDLLQRTVVTASQTKLSKEQRQANIKGVFTLSSSQSIKGATFVVVDDVFTTGATLKEVAKTLKRSGAAKVFGFVLAQD